MLVELRDIEFSKFKKLIFDKIGISLGDNKKTLLSSRLAKRVRFYNLNSYSKYYDLILRDPNELQIMINLITTNETYFFREKKHFEYLKSILPSNQKETFRVWSAACSTGAEPYSIAMTLRENAYLKWEIVASDINSDVLKIAKEAIYPLESASSISASYLKKYCLKGENRYEGFFKIKNSLRENINFMQLNLNSPLPNIGLFDVVFLRNVLIYFDKSKKKEIVENIFKHLRKDGILIIGHSESLFGITEKYQMIKSTIYKKI